MLLLDPFSGAAGDMFLGALLDLGVGLDEVRAALATLPIGGWRLDADRVTRGGIAATKVHVRLDVLGGAEEGDRPREGVRGGAAAHDAGAHAHEHAHPHGQHHHPHVHDHDHPHGGHHGHHHAHGAAPAHGTDFGPEESPAAYGFGAGMDPSGSSTTEELDTHGHPPAMVALHAANHHGQGTPHLSATGHGRSPREILDVLARSGLPGAVKHLASEAFLHLARAEAKVHGRSMEDVHFHEVGALDAIIDICGTAFALHRLGIERVYSQPVVTGSGTIRCAHGELPVPGPATQEMILGMPVRPGPIEAELLTPTGAALLRAVGTDFAAPPAHRLLATGYGAGRDEHPGVPNLLRASVAESIAAAGGAQAAPGTVVEIRFEVDDMTPEALGHLREVLPAELVLDLSVTPVQMKKGRPGHRVTLLAPEGALDQLEPLIFRHTTTFGFRFAREERRVLEREIATIGTPIGPARVKVGRWRGEVVRLHPEPDDVAELARRTGRSYAEVERLVRACAERG